MSFPLFQYLTPPPAPANPNAAAGNLTSAAQGWMADRRENARLEEQKSEYGQTHELASRAEARYAAADQFDRQKAKVALIGEYNQKLQAGDYAGAAAMAPQMKMLGLEPKLHDDSTPGVSADDWAAHHEQTPGQAPPAPGAAAPSAQPGAPAPQAQPAAGAPPGAEPAPAPVATPASVPAAMFAEAKPPPRKGRDKVPPLLSRYMANRKPAQEGAYAEPGIGASADRLENIDPEGVGSRDVGDDELLRKMGGRPGNVGAGIFGGDKALRRMGGIPGETDPGIYKIPEMYGDEGVSASPSHGTPGPAAPAPAPGAAPTPQTTSLAKPRMPVYEFVDTETGKSYGIIDPNKAKQQNIDTARRVGAGFVGALPEEVRPIGEAATRPAETAAEQTYAVGNALSLIEQAMRSAAAAKHGKGGGAAPGGFPVGKEAHALQAEIRTTMQAAATDQKVADSNKTLNSISQGLAGLREGGTVGERGAVAQLIKAAFPGAISDQERTYITEANGISGKIANALGYWVETGHMDPALIAQVKKLQEIAAELTKERLRNAATEVAENWGRIHPELSPEAREAYIQEGISLHSPEAAKRRRDSLTPKGQERPGFLK